MSSEPVFWDCYYQRPQMTTGAAALPRMRSSANEKERGRVQTVNTAFNHLRTLIPTDPKDRKLSKVETLRLAASYISHLSSVLIVGSSDNQPCSRHRNRQTRNVCTFCISGLKNRTNRKSGVVDRKPIRPNEQPLPANNCTAAPMYEDCNNYRSAHCQENDDWSVYSSNQAVVQWLAVQDTMMGDDVI